LGSVSLAIGKGRVRWSAIGVCLRVCSTIGKRIGSGVEGSVDGAVRLGGVSCAVGDSAINGRRVRFHIWGGVGASIWTLTGTPETIVGAGLNAFGSRGASAGLRLPSGAFRDRRGGVVATSAADSPKRKENSGREKMSTVQHDCVSQKKRDVMMSEVATYFNDKSGTPQ